MAFPKSIWNQLKNTTAQAIISALGKDGWLEEESRKATLAYRKNSSRIVIHYHPNKTYGPKLLKALIDDIGWSESDLKRLKLIKQH